MQHCSVEAMLVAGPEDMRSDAEADLGDPELARDICACFPTSGRLKLPFLPFSRYFTLIQRHVHVHAICKCTLL